MASGFPPRFEPPVIVAGEALPLPPAERRAGYWPDDDAAYLKSGRVDHDLIVAAAGGYLDLQRKLRILDCHCLSGRVLRHFEAERQAAGWQPHGIDGDPLAIEWLRTHWPTEYEVATVSDAIPALPFEDNFFDIVYGIAVFTRITQLWDAWLCEFRRILKPGGICLQTVQCETAWSLYARGETAWQKAGVPEHVRRHPQMDVDYLLFDGGPVSNAFYRRDVVERRFGRYMPVRDVLDPPELGFQ